MNEFKILTYEQCFDSRIDLLENINLKAVITDYGILLGGAVEASYFDDEMKERGGSYWISHENDSNGINIDENGWKGWMDSDVRFIGGRPWTKYSKIKSFCKKVKKRKDGYLEVDYGEYPQYLTTQEISKELEQLYQKSILRKTGKTYTIDKTEMDEYHSGFSQKQILEYEYNGKKYVRMEGTEKGSGDYLSDGNIAEINEVYWLEVEPVKWIVDEKDDIALSEKILFAGIQYNNLSKDENKNQDYDKSDYKEYIDKYFSKEIKPSPYKQLTKEEQEQLEEARNKVEKRTNSYEFENKEVTEEEIIKGAIESDLAVFLHGPSSEGKSARVKAIDPDCIVIYLRNATPDSLNGKSICIDKELVDVKPNWLKKLEEKCEKEPEKNHIVFFDEITNALPSIQGMAFNIVLNKEVNGIWQLPKNARIVAAGNDMKDSLAANQLAEPLFNRFVHVYIKTTTESWLKWASENNIHPAIYAYIASTNGKSLRTEYNGETPNADPRKWEMASKMLYQTNNPEMLRGLIGEEVTKEFIEFCKQPIITLKDVLENNYTDEEINALKESERYAIACGLSQVEEENLEKIRRFMLKVGAEETRIFDALWVHNDEKRLERLAEAKLENMQEKQEKIKVKVKRK